MRRLAAPGEARIRQYSVRGVRIDAVDIERTLRQLDEWIRERRREYVIFQGAHGVIEALDCPELLEINNRAGLVVPDGTPGAWLGRALGFDETGRVYGPDLLIAAAERGLADGWRHFFYGGKPGVALRLAERLTERFPTLVVAGTWTPPFRELSAIEGDDIVAELNRARPDLIWVGLGCPRQDRWMARFRGRLEAPVLLGVGAAFDFHTGALRMAPRWMQRCGLEWLFRLGVEPRRLFSRYSRVVPRYLVLLLSEYGTAAIRRPGRRSR